MRKRWISYVVTVSLDLSNEARKDNMPWARITAGASLATFLTENDIIPGEIIVLEHHVNNGAMHYYVLIFSDNEYGREFKTPEKVTVIAS